MNGLNENWFEQEHEILNGGKKKIWIRLRNLLEKLNFFFFCIYLSRRNNEYVASSKSFPCNSMDYMEISRKVRLSKIAILAAYLLFTIYKFSSFCFINTVLRNALGIMQCTEML